MPRALAAIALPLLSAHAMPYGGGYGHLEFDYVVVGAGPGGLTIASRLSEDPSISVAIIEAGTWSTKVTGNQSQVPAYDFHYNGKAHNDTNPSVDWGFITSPQSVWPRHRPLLLEYVLTAVGTGNRWPNCALQPREVARGLDQPELHGICPYEQRRP
jgi:choline dehydrogenase-like flavoprotein